MSTTKNALWKTSETIPIHLDLHTGFSRLQSSGHSNWRQRTWYDTGGISEII
jgi:hypothetical protein